MAESPPLSGITVLLVDDGPDDLALIGTLLRDAGADVTAVASVEEALRALQKARPRVVVSDLVIPGHDGFTLIRRIRRLEKEQGGDLPALAISGFAYAEQGRYALEEGFDEYLAKPVHERIVATVARMASPPELAALRHKYDSVVRLMHARGVQVRTIEMQGTRLLLRAEAPSADVKDAIWNEIKRVDPGFSDLSADITVGAGVAAGQGGPSGGVSAPEGSYTVKKGDTLSKISKQFYGDANAYRKIFDANRDQLEDPDKIQPGQVLRIPS